MTKKLLFISMLGEYEHFKPELFSSLCQSGLERDWILDWHSALATQCGLQMSAIDICRGDTLPAADEISSVVLGGTMHVITERRKWLDDLRAWLPVYKRTGNPLLSICGGHQMLASQYGEGRLTGRSKGALTGTYEITLTEAGVSHPLFSGMPIAPRFHFANYLHIIPSVDQESGVLAIQEGSPAIAIDYGGNWFSCQFHPESRKDSWDIYYGALEEGYVSAYMVDHHGQQLLENFFRFSS
jgi:GMP synthase (glutamine-hydrolysing)